MIISSPTLIRLIIFCMTPTPPPPPKKKVLDSAIVLGWTFLDIVISGGGQLRTFKSCQDFGTKGNFGASCTIGGAHFAQNSPN